MISHLRKVFSKRYIFRSAVTGRFVTKAYALLHPRETYGIEIRQP